eukprot:1161773-Pelagomonas_calceolata.AAC.19
MVELMSVPHSKKPHVDTSCQEMSSLNNRYKHCLKHTRNRFAAAADKQWQQRTRRADSTGPDVLTAQYMTAGMHNTCISRLRKTRVANVICSAEPPQHYGFFTGRNEVEQALHAGTHCLPHTVPLMEVPNPEHAHEAGSVDPLAFPPFHLCVAAAAAVAAAGAHALCLILLARPVH